MAAADGLRDAIRILRSARWLFCFVQHKRTLPQTHTHSQTHRQSGCCTTRVVYRVMVYHHHHYRSHRLVGFFICFCGTRNVHNIDLKKREFVLNTTLGSTSRFSVRCSLVLVVFWCCCCCHVQCAIHAISKWRDGENALEGNWCFDVSQKTFYDTNRRSTHHMLCSEKYFYIIFLLIKQMEKCIFVWVVKLN